MNSELPRSADALLAERERLEQELQSCEDWLELLHLKSRKDRGEGMSAVNSARLEMVLLDSLAENPDFVRYKAVCVALERLIRGSPSSPPAPRPAPKAEIVRPPAVIDDLTQIRGIGASMARRLNDAGVTTFAQIAEWRAADIRNFSTELGLAKQIYTQNWIEQAAVLANSTGDTAAPVKPPVADPAPRAVQPPPQPASQQFVQPVAVAKVPVQQNPVAQPPQSQKTVADPAPVEQAAVRPAAAAPIPTLVPTVPDVKVEKPVLPTPVAAVQAAATPVPAVPPVAAPAIVAAPKPEPIKLEPVASEPPAKPVAPVVIVQAVEPSPPEIKPPQQLPPVALRPPLPAASSPPLVTPLPIRAAETTAVPAPASLPIPPRPLVVTRASVGSVMRDATSAPFVPPPPRANDAATIAKPVPSLAPALPQRPALPPQAQPAAAPQMTISEAIAYAAEVARQGQRPSVQRVESQRPEPAPASKAVANAGPGPALNGKAAASPPPPIREAARMAAEPPPLPAGFVPPDDQTSGPRAGDRDDFGGQRLNVEEATVEIVRRGPPAPQIPKPAVIFAVQDAPKADQPRSPTPMGRFLKALTGNS